MLSSTTTFLRRLSQASFFTEFSMNLWLCSFINYLLLFKFTQAFCTNSGIISKDNILILGFYLTKKSTVKYIFAKLAAIKTSHCLTLIWRGERRGNSPPPPSWLFLNSSKTIKAVTLAFCSIKQHYIRDICAKCCIPNLPQSPDIDQNTEGGISDFGISGQSFINVIITPEQKNKSCHNSRTNHYTDIKLGPAGKLDKRNTKTSKKLTMKSCRQIVTSLPFLNLWPICSHPEAGFRKHGL